MQQAVPAGAICVTADVVNSTYDESIAVRHWARTNGVSRVIIVTDVFHSRRVHWLFGKQLPAIRVAVDATPVREYSVRDWWANDQGVISFQNEVLKYAYYRLKY